MGDSAHLWLFFGLVFGIVILPGMDMAFVLGSARAIGALLIAVAALTVLEGWRRAPGFVDRAATRSQAVAWPARSPLPRR
jgi:hypothetical protein